MDALIPRKVEPESSRRWLRESLQLIWRTLPSWLLGIFIFSAVPLTTIALSENTAVVGLVLFAVLIISPFFNAALVHAFEGAVQARRSSLAHLGDKLAVQWQDLAREGLWCSAIFFLAVLLMMAIQWAITPSSDANPARVWDSFWLMQMHLFAWPLIFRRSGPMGFRYFLESHRKLPSEVRTSLEREAISKNGPLLIRWTFTYYIALLITASSSILMPLMVSLAWLWVAVNYCAYRDIFEHQTGLKQPQRAPSAAVVT